MFDPSSSQAFSATPAPWRIAKLDSSASLVSVGEGANSPIDRRCDESARAG
jgi:hypothetical protein